MIDVKNISFKYAGSKHLVFDDFSLTLEENRIYGLLGKNGTGKRRTVRKERNGQEYAALPAFRFAPPLLRYSVLRWHRNQGPRA